MALNFPASPTNNEIYEDPLSGLVYRYTSSTNSWEVLGDSSNPLSIGTQGPPGDPGGPPGPQGPQGDQGARGAQGDQGSRGFQGDPGLGLTGPQGNQGNQGTQGIAGSQGPQGSTGSQGFQGAQGISGPQGDQGSTGSQGPQGFQGNQGSTGSQGPQGAQGFQGSSGSQGPQGSQGNQGFQGNQGAQAATLPAPLGVICSDEVTPITTGPNKFTFSMPLAGTIVSLYASCITAPTGSDIIIDINKNASSILSTKLRINAGANNSVGSTPFYVISDTALAIGDTLSFDFDQVGSTIAGVGVKVWMIINYTF